MGFKRYLMQEIDWGNRLICLKLDILLVFQSNKCDNIQALFLLVRGASAMGFMSGGMVVGTASKGFCNYLKCKMGNRKGEFQ